jgi:HlyD family secretion protein
VRQVRKAALNVANVVTYVAVLSYANTDGRLLPGLTANVRVVTQERPDVLRVPNGALRLRIAGVEPAAKGKGLARVYVLDEAGKPRAVAVRTGISDGSLTELVDDPQAPLGPELAPGTEVLVAVKTPPASAPKPSGMRPGF